MLFTKPRKLSLEVRAILWKKEKSTSVNDRAIYFDLYARKYEQYMKCDAFSNTFIIYFWNYGCSVCIFSIFSWWALPQFLSLAYHEVRWFRTQKKILQTIRELVFLSSDHWNELAVNTRSPDSSVIPNDQRKQKSTGKLKLKSWVCSLRIALFHLVMASQFFSELFLSV